MDADHEATYSPQDDKIRLYFAYRIDRPAWDALRALGFTWTMKQKEAGGCDMVAPWTPERETRALELAGEIGDEDQPREERAAQRAERFEGYQQKRFAEATGQADAFDATPSVHGHQNLQRAERAAAKHDRIAARAVSQWDKAEYWTTRTAGVISHALYAERADVRHRRIKGIEADLRRFKSEVEPSEIIEGVEAVIRYRGGIVPKRMSSADLRLVVSAPELLAALREAHIDMFEFMEPTPERHKAIKKVQAAIAKAELER